MNNTKEDLNNAQKYFDDRVSKQKFAKTALEARVRELSELKKSIAAAEAAVKAAEDSVAKHEQMVASATKGLAAAKAARKEAISRGWK